METLNTLTAATLPLTTSPTASKRDGLRAPLYGYPDEHDADMEPIDYLRLYTSQQELGKEQMERYRQKGLDKSGYSVHTFVDADELIEYLAKCPGVLGVIFPGGQEVTTLGHTDEATRNELRAAWFIATAPMQFRFEGIYKLRIGSVDWLSGAEAVIWLPDGTQYGRTIATVHAASGGHFSHQEVAEITAMMAGLHRARWDGSGYVVGEAPGPLCYQDGPSVTPERVIGSLNYLNGEVDKKRAAHQAQQNRPRSVQRNPDCECCGREMIADEWHGAGLRLICTNGDCPSNQGGRD